MGEGNLFFFGGGKKREGKSSFADFGFGAGEAVCKCAFTVAVGFLICFKNFIGRMSLYIVKIEVYTIPI